MQQVILAVQTPRAGKWNHRWIVPKGVVVDDVTLTKALSKFDSLNSGAIVKDGVVFYRSVEQSSSGRSAREYVFLYFPDLENAISDRGKKRCCDLLEDYFESKMDAMVTSINWDRVGSAMIYVSSDSDFATLCDNLNQTIQQNMEPSNVSEEDQKTKKGCRFGCTRFLFTLIAILTILFCLNRGEIRKWINQSLNEQQAGSGEDKPSNPEGIVSKQNEGTSTSNDNSKKITDEDFKEWQKLFTFPDEVDKAKQYTMVQNTVDAAYIYCHPDVNEVSVNETDISKMGNFAQKLYNLRDKVFEPDNGVPDGDFVNRVNDKNINPIEFRKLVNNWSGANKALKNMITSYNDSLPDSEKTIVGNIETGLDNFLEAVKADKKVWSVSDGQIFPRFFFNEDSNTIKSIREYIDNFSNVDKSKDTINAAIQYCSKRAKKNPGDYENYLTWSKFVDQFNKWFPENE